MHVVVAKDHEAMSRRAADLVVDEVRRSASLTLCAATGSSPTRMYEILGEHARAEPKLFDALTLVKLDEWGGLPPDAEGTCEAYLRRYLVGPLKVSEDRYVAFRGDAAEPTAECERIAARLDAMEPIDLCVLGLGLNGHLGFNEPADALDPRPHVAELSETSLSHSMMSDLDEKPSYGLTLGLADIMRSRRVLLLVSGEHKRDALSSLLIPRVTTSFPASFLWLHPDATVFCDEAASQNRAR